ncbi:hypothetical protein [Streptomyces sp. 6-11-2]|uniref:hypothetical protein n=1 Tax=unclassified Streptomyces TaxID=2593676 RepID=UPI0011419883|nr:hypothetical protein [Streptomyces sp. 6-11-2]
MPTPYGTRGGMAFGAEELPVLRRALALALQPRPASAEDVQECRRLAESLDEAMHEGVRLRAFLVADLARYRAALPGAAAGYLVLLADCLDAGHRPTADDLAALGALRGAPAAATLLRRCRTLTPPVAPPSESASAHPVPAAHPAPAEPPAPAARAAAPVHPAGPLRTGQGAPSAVTASLGVLQALMGGPPGGRGAQQEDGGDEKPAQKPAAKPGERPAPAQPGTAPAPKPVRRPVPTPGEVFPRRKPGPPSGKPQQCLAAV